MNIVTAIILGLVEGVTEFLPISSTAHLILTAKLLSIPQDAFTSFFEVAVQSFAILAVITTYAGMLIKKPDLLKKVLVSFVPTAVVGLAFHTIIKTIFFQSYMLIGLAMAVIGGVFIALEKGFFTKGKKLDLEQTLGTMTYKQAFAIGLWQSMAIIPGVSRAGSVIIGMLLMRFKRADSAKYSIILAIPTIGAATLLDFVKLDPGILTGERVGLLLAGGVAAFLTALICIKWLVSYLQRETLIPFGIYRIVIGLLVIIGFGLSL